MSLSETSLDAYHSLKAHVLSAQCQEVMDLMRDGKARTREQIAKEIGLKESSVCGRANGLVAAGLLVESVSETAKTQSGRAAKLLRVPPLANQMAMF